MGVGICGGRMVCIGGGMESVCLLYLHALGCDTLYTRYYKLLYIDVFYPARACAARGKVISRGWWWCPQKKIYSFFGTNLLSLKILTFRALFQHR